MYEPGADLSGRIIDLALQVHRGLGPGLLESVYENALCIELDDAKVDYRRQEAVQALYKGRVVGDFRPDLIVDGRIVVEIKSVERHDPVFDAQLLTYMKLTGIPLGLLLNFNSALLRQGI